MTPGLLLDILAPPFLAGLLVLATHVPLGRQVLGRGIIFLDLAVAQIAALGVIGVQILHLGHGVALLPEAWLDQIAAGAAALAGAFVLYWTERRWPAIQEALIGCAFILAATGGILLLAHDPHGGEHLQDLLAGKLLWTGWPKLLPLALLSGIILVLWAVLRQRAGSLFFYFVFALAVTASVQLVGVYLVFASLIMPALAVRGLRGPRALGIGYAVGVVGYGSGLLLSVLADLPSGTAIVWTLAISAVICAACIRITVDNPRPQAGTTCDGDQQHL